MEALVNTAILKGAEKLGVVLKEKQLESIKQFCLGKDVFVSLPTGYGKSIIYAILPSAFNHIRGIKLLLSYTRRTKKILI